MSLKNSAVLGDDERLLIEKKTYRSRLKTILLCAPLLLSALIALRIVSGG
jgi:hypothetical protein